MNALVTFPREETVFFMSFSALLCAYTIAKKRNRFYLDALIRSLIQDADTLSLDSLPKFYCPILLEL